MENIYLPINSVDDFACYSVYDKDTIRAYRTMPTINGSSNYVDFYINSHYLESEGTQSWGQWTNYLPTCISTNAITTDYYYRTDMPEILIMVIIIALCVIYLPYKIISRLFGRYLQL